MEGDLLYLIKKVAVDAVETSKPCTWLYANVVDTTPLKVKIADNFTIDDDFIEFGNKKIENIEKGDKLILLRQAGGQLFLCLDIIKGGD